MNIKDVLSKIKKNHQDKSDIIFENEKLEIVIGQWLGVIPYPWTNVKLTQNIHEKIKEMVLDILIKVGNSSFKKCVINYLEPNIITFLCDGKVLKMIFKTKNFESNYAELDVLCDNENKTYIYKNDGGEVDLSLQNYTIYNLDNGNRYYRYLSFYSSYFILENQDMALSVTIDRSTEDYSHFSFQPHHLDHEEDIEKYLLSLSFPIDMIDFSLKMEELLGKSIFKYPKIELELVHKNENVKREIIDGFLFHFGELITSVITRNGASVIIDSNGNWTYETNKFIIKQKAGSSSYSVEISEQEMPLFVDEEQYYMASSDVDEVKKLIRKL